MNRVNHELLKKEFGKTKNCLVIGLVCLVLSIICTGLVYYNESGSKIPKNTTYLNETSKPTSKSMMYHQRLPLKTTNLTKVYML